MSSSKRPTARPASSGFSLIEVIAALAILSVAITALISLFGQSLRNIGRMEDSALAMVHARSAMDEALATSPLEPGTDTKSFDDGYNASVTIAELDLPVSKQNADKMPKAYSITVTVKSPDGGGVTLKSRTSVNEKKL